jgi:hypothetical protein
MFQTSKEQKIEAITEPLAPQEKKHQEVKNIWECKYQDDKRWIGYLFQLIHISMVCGH